MLCRVCGNEMIAFEYCTDCNEAVHWKCSICYKENEKSVHTHYIKEQEEEKSSKMVSVASATNAAAIVLSFISSLSSQALS